MAQTLAARGPARQASAAPSRAMMDALYAILSSEPYVTLVVVAILGFGASSALLPVLFMPGAQVSVAALARALSPVDYAVLVPLSILFGLVTAMQVFELRRIARPSRARGAAGGVFMTVLGVVAAKSCCILPLLLLALGSLSSALFVSSHLLAIRLLGGALLGTVFLFTALRVGRAVGTPAAPCCAPEAR